MVIIDRRYSVAEGLAYKAPCRAATTANITLSGLQTVDGISLAAGDRVLVKNQTDGTQNGIYAASTGAWTRERDFDGALDVVTGTAVYVASGSTNSGHVYLVSTTGTITPGTTSITFIQDASSTYADTVAGMTALSSSSVAIGTGSKTFTIPAGKNFVLDQWVLVYETSAPNTAMLAQITSYSGTTLTVNSVATGGSGTHTDWTIVLANSPASAGRVPPFGAGDVVGPAAAVADRVVSFDSTSGKLVKDSGIASGSVVLGPASVTTNRLVSFDGTTGKLIKDSGLDSSSVIAASTTLRDDGKLLYYDTSAATHKYAWASPKDPHADLRDFLDAQYGVGGWTYRTAPGNGSDCLPALHAALDALRSRYGYGTLRIVGAGVFRLVGGINPEKLKGHFIIGENTSISQVVFDFGAGPMFHFTGAGGYAGGGLKNLNIYLEEGYPSSTVTQILAEGDADFQPNGIVLENLGFSAFGTSRYYDGIFLNGTGKTTGARGIRIPQIKNVQLFFATHVGAYFGNCIQASIDNFGIYSGTGGGSDCYITGGGSSLSNTTQMDFRRFLVEGVLRVNNCTKVWLNGSVGSLLADTTATYIAGFIEGPISGSFGSNSHVTAM